MSSTLILPDYILSFFVSSDACHKCRRSDQLFTLLAPQLNWLTNSVELIYPLRCPCGGAGCVRINLPVLLYGYILAKVSLADAARRRRSKAKIRVFAAGQDNFVANMVRDFDRIIFSLRDGDTSQTAHGVRTTGLDGSCDDAERIRFGFDRDEWKAFLRRLGMDEDEKPESEGG